MATLVPNRDAMLQIYWSAWKRANEEYLAARLAYDLKVQQHVRANEALRNTFLLKKANVKIATDAYYSYLNDGKPVTLTQKEESVLFSPDDIKRLKALAKARTSQTQEK